MKFSALVTQVSGLLTDAGHVGWSESDIRSYLAESERVIVSMRPDAGAITTIVVLSAGPRQKIPTDGVQLLDVVRNQNGRVIRRLSRADKDAANLRWMGATPSNEIREYVFDEAIPKEYLVSPPANAGVQVEIAYVRNPPVPNFAADPDITLDEIYSPVMVDYAVSRALSRADENTPDLAKSQMYWQAFTAKVVGKTQADTGIHTRRAKQ